MKKISERLKELRKQAGFTQKQIGEYLGIDSGSYAWYEREKGNPTRQAILMLCDLYQVSAEYLTGGEETGKKYKQGEWEAFPQRLKKLRRTSNMKQKEVAEVLKIHRESYVYYENGKFEPRMVNLYQLKNLFGVSMDELLGRIEEEK
ncbi:MAG: helix-turn-helix domain-containing protein [Clostridia bacterium]|nr:helix-turn-helix domain-containing protein [Clostridia bacterium]